MADRTTIKDGSYFKTLSRKNHQYYEVLIPNEFTPKSPWGSFPHERWDEWTEKLKGIQYPECLLNDTDFTTHIPIYSVSHVTHNKPARMITPTLAGGNYSFKPRSKLGRVPPREYRDGLHLGETFKRLEDQKYERIWSSESNPLFPGYLSWWGINVRTFYDTKDGRKLENCIQEIRKKQYYVPDYLRTTPAASRYGNKSFSISMKDLFLSYQKSRKDKPDCRVQLKLGGTLLYENEICYVIMVCLEGDSELQSMSAIDASNCIYSRPFQHNELLDPAGFVKDYDKTPTFRATYIVSSVEENAFNWEQLVFALYFPSPSLTLDCPREKITEESVEHTFCIATIPPASGKKWVCPNKLEPPSLSQVAHS